MWVSMNVCMHSYIHTQSQSHPNAHNKLSNVAAKVFLDKAVFTPPFLAVTLFLLRLLESGRPKASLAGARAVYLPSLKTNLKVGRSVGIRGAGF